MGEGNDFIVDSIASFTSFDESRILSPYIFYKSNFCNYFATIIKGSWFLYFRKVKFWFENMFKRFSFFQKHIKRLHSFHFFRGIFGFVFETDPLAQIKTLNFEKKLKIYQICVKKLKWNRNWNILKSMVFLQMIMVIRKRRKRKNRRWKTSEGKKIQEFFEGKNVFHLSFFSTYKN